MTHRIKQSLGSMIDHYPAFCLALALVILSLIGVGDVRVTSLAGVLLCGVGVTQDSVKVDLWTLLPLIIYDLAAMVYSYMAYGNIVDGYGAMHALYPVIYLVTASLSGEDTRLLKRCCVLWMGIMAAVGIGRFVFRAVTTGRVSRMTGLLGNSNAMGIFLVVGWFAVMYLGEEDGKENRKKKSI